MIGQTISHFEVIEKLGEGGMGVVYKARDTQLDRFVALKVLPAQMVADPERRRRFMQEAKAASALNHPNIITVYEISSYEDGEFIAMEFVRGKTLDALIGRKGLTLDHTLKYAVQITEALAAAHASGIIHRDVKPANIMITDSGLVKVLDFGLAKLTEPIGTDLDGAGVTRGVDQMLRTTEGMIAGTAAYMSPEQAEGKPVDSRTDIFSFGSVLYEMITGQRPFQGASPLSVLTSVLRDDPQPVAAIAGSVPPELERIMNRCLRKDPDRRWHSMKDVQVALAEIKEESDSATMLTSRPNLPASATVRATASQRHLATGKPVMKEALIAGAVLLAGIAGLTIWRSRSENPRVVRTPAPPPLVVTPPRNRPSPMGDLLLTNDGIIELEQGGVKDGVIIDRIKHAKTNFDFSPAEIVRLSKAGVSGEVIAAMQNPQAAADPSDSLSARRSVTIPEGTKVRLTVLEDVLVSTAKKGDPLACKVAENVRVDGALVIARGAAASGVVADAEKKKIFGRGNKLILQFVSAQAVDGQPVRLSSKIVVGKGSPDWNKPGAKIKETMVLYGSVFVANVDADRTITIAAPDTPQQIPPR
ncbi:MAG: serine/threonine protein kinase [Acidobacteriota bacterium]|nr:serine/threonine protein kinase [Acidobacteriota bacterium]